MRWRSRRRASIATCRSSWGMEQPILSYASSGATRPGRRWSAPATRSSGTPMVWSIRCAWRKSARCRRGCNECCGAEASIRAHAQPRAVVGDDGESQPRVKAACGIAVEHQQFHVPMRVAREREHRVDDRGADTAIAFACDQFDVAQEYLPPVAGQADAADRGSAKRSAHDKCIVRWHIMRGEVRALPTVVPAPCRFDIFAQCGAMQLEQILLIVASRGAQSAPAECRVVAEP